jgi:hypothetical protein
MVGYFTHLSSVQVLKLITKQPNQNLNFFSDVSFTVFFNTTPPHPENNLKKSIGGLNVGGYVEVSSM